MSTQPSVSTLELRTFRLDTTRLTIDGVVATLIQSVFLVVAIRVFDASDFALSSIAAAPAVGLMASLFYAAGYSRSGIRRAVLAAVPGVSAGFLLAGAGIAQSALLFGLFTVTAVVAHKIATPFVLGIYADNYHPSRRGRLFSVGLTLSLLVTAATGWIFGQLLELDIELYRPILLGSGLGVAGGSALLLLVPTRRTVRRGEANVLRNLQVVLTDRRFGLILLALFVAGFANLWSQPLRVTYLTEAERGLNLSPVAVLVLTSALPSLVRVFFTRLWAVLFDRFDLVILRIIMNLLIGVGILVFFLSASLVIIGLGTVLISLGMAGTFIAWNLWVTKIAPPGREQLYMSVHTFLTGVRGVLGPFVGFLFVGGSGFLEMGVVSLVLTVISSIILLPARGGLQTGSRP